MKVFQKSRWLFLTAITLLLVGVLSGCGGASERDSESQTETEETETVEIVKPTFQADLSVYESYIDVPSGSYLTLVNKQNTVDGSYDPGEMMAVKDTWKDISLQKNAAMAMEAMFTEMREAGIGGVFVTSAYRSYAYQNGLFNTYIQNEMAANPSLTEAEARALVLRYSAFPGTSEHHTGLAADLMVEGMTDLDESFAQYPVFDWLQENAWKFGFILRFPEDKVDITGYDYEPWHYRFVGRYDAYMIWSQGICLEEYVENYGG